jgi:hypothetical protein
MERQTDRQKERWMCGRANKQMGGQMDGRTKIQMDKWVDRQMDGQTDSN